ncbi:O-antigen ligase family protein [Parvibaculaceae bacterium PLY_AMNH_Bact1]|nr:O-antigen ligase family protein [Parvibaculaceae bacterium PLY_AMNH_Bact1]
MLIQLIPGIPFGLAHPAWQDISIFFGVSIPGRISIDPDGSMTVFMRWMAYAAVFWLALQLGRDRANAGMALRAFVWAGAAYALYGLTAYLTGGETILFYKKWAYREALTSTFVNRNSYATFAGMGLIVAFLLILNGAKRYHTKDQSLRQKMLFHLGRAGPALLFLGTAAFLILSALILTGSRAGAFSTLAALLVVLVCTGAGKSRHRYGLGAPVVFFGLMAIAVYALSSEFLLARLENASLGARQMTYLQTIEAITDHSVLGSGLGSFAQIFPLYRADDALVAKFWGRAHNTYIENILELGLPAALALFVAVGALAARCWRGVQARSRDRHFPIMGVAVSVLVGLHSFVDFSLQIPAVTIAYMFLLGIAVAQSFSSRRA